MVSKLKFLYLLQCIFPGSLSQTTGGHGQSGAVASPKQLRRHQQDAAAQGLQRSGLKLLWQAQTFEPIHQIVGQQ